MVNNCNFSLTGFTILEKLNANHIGGRSSYLAEDIATQQMVVVKQFEFAKEGSDWSGYKQLKREIDYLQTVDHPYICKYVDTVETKAGLCLITEYIEGTPLNQ